MKNIKLIKTQFSQANLGNSRTYTSDMLIIALFSSQVLLSHEMSSSTKSPKLNGNARPIFTGE